MKRNALLSINGTIKLLEIPLHMEIHELYSTMNLLLYRSYVIYIAFHVDVCMSKVGIVSSSMLFLK